MSYRLNRDIHPKTRGFAEVSLETRFEIAGDRPGIFGFIPYTVAMTKKQFSAAIKSTLLPPVLHGVELDGLNFDFSKRYDGGFETTMSAYDFDELIKRKGFLRESKLRAPKHSNN